MQSALADPSSSASTGLAVKTRPYFFEIITGPGQLALEMDWVQERPMLGPCRS
jgi:hypothetical protein